MIYLGGLVGVAVLLLWIFCLVDVVTSRDAPELLPRWGWLVVVLLLPLLGSLLWLVVGRPRSSRPGSRPFERSAPRFPEYDRPGRFAALEPDADAEFLRRCRERAEEQRRKAGGDTGPTGTP